MRILLLCTQFRFIGGIAEFVDNLASEMLLPGHQVEVACTYYGVSGTEREPLSRIPVHTIRIPATKRASIRHPERLLRWGHGRELGALIGRVRPDVVHSHVNQWNKLPAITEGARLAGVPLVQTLADCYGGDWSDPAPLKALKGAAVLCALSESVRDGLARFYPPIATAQVIRGGVDCARAAQSVASSRARPYILTASRLQLSSKALDVVVEAFAAICPSQPELDLVIAGEGPDRARLTALASELRIGERVELTGAIPRATLWELYKGAQFFVMASRRPEGLGLVFLESMACGRPVIGTRSGGVPEVVHHGEDGLLVERNEAPEFADAMRWMLTHPDECNQMGQRGLATVRAEYDWPRVAARYLAVYENAIGSWKRA